MEAAITVKAKGIARTGIRSRRSSPHDTKHTNPVKKAA
jgi:hypothetical protein